MSMDSKSKREVTSTFLLILQIGINMLVPIFMCTLVGVYIGRQIDRSYPAIVGFIIGSIAGFNGVYKLVKKYLVVKKHPGELKREAEERENNNQQNQKTE